MGFRVYPLEACCFRLAVRNSDPHPLGRPQSCSPSRPRSRPPNSLPACGDGYILVDSTGDSARSSQCNSLRGSVRCCPGSSDRRGPRRIRCRPPSGTDRSFPGCCDSPLPSSFPSSSPRSFWGCAASSQSEVLGGRNPGWRFCRLLNGREHRELYFRLSIGSLSDRGYSG